MKVWKDADATHGNHEQTQNDQSLHVVKGLPYKDINNVNLNRVIPKTVLSMTKHILAQKDDSKLLMAH